MAFPFGFGKNNDDEVFEIEELILSMEEEPNNENKKMTTTNIFYLKNVQDIREAISKIENALLKNYALVIVNYNNLKTALKEREFLSAINASLRNRGVNLRKISDSKILLITPKTTNIIVG